MEQRGVTDRAMEMLSRVAFGAASVVLMALSLMLIGFGVTGVIAAAAASWTATSSALLSAIGYVVIAIAVFDVAKYFIEEEVIRGREMRLTSEARRSLTKFISTISIAMFIEALVMVFQVKDEVEKLVYPTGLLLTAILVVVGLGLYQRLAADVEQKVEAKDKAKRN